LSQKQRSDYVFRSSFSNSQASHPLGEWAYRQGYRKMVLLASDFAAGHEHIGGVARTFVAAGGQIIQEIYTPLGAPDFAPYLAQIRRDADVVAVAIFGADALRVVTQYAEFGLKGKIAMIGKGGLTDEAFLDKMGDAALGVVVAFNWSAALDTPENRRFRESFESKYKRPVSLTAESGYVGAQMLARALESTKGNVESPDTFLAALRDSATVKFGAGFWGPFPLGRYVEYAVAAERLGFDSVWIGDTQLLTPDLYSAMALCANATSRIKIGSGVTNTVTRDLTVTAG